MLETEAFFARDLQRTHFGKCRNVPAVPAIVVPPAITGLLTTVLDDAQDLPANAIRTALQKQFPETEFSDNSSFLLGFRVYSAGADSVVLCLRSGSSGLYLQIVLDLPADILRGETLPEVTGIRALPKWLRFDLPDGSCRFVFFCLG